MLWLDSAVSPLLAVSFSQMKVVEHVRAPDLLNIPSARKGPEVRRACGHDCWSPVQVRYNAEQQHPCAHDYCTNNHVHMAPN